MAERRRVRAAIQADYRRVNKKPSAKPIPATTSIEFNGCLRMRSSSEWRMSQAIDLPCSMYCDAVSCMSLELVLHGVLDVGAELLGRMHRRAGLFLRRGLEVFGLASQIVRRAASAIAEVGTGHDEFPPEA